MATTTAELELPTRKLDAERVTWLAQSFLNRLGYRRTALRPRKVTLEGEKYLVEIQVQNRTATVQVDINTGEIKGFQIEEQEQGSSFAASKRTILIIGGGIAIAAVVIILKLTGIF